MSGVTNDNVINENVSHANVELLRHTVATLAYRASKALAGVPESFADFAAPGGARTPGQILAHLCDLIDWSGGLVAGRHQWRASVPQAWDAEVARFFAGLAEFDRALAHADPAVLPAQKLFQGPIADALTHVGQLLLLRRMAGCPVRGENYFVAEIAVGRVGSEQTAPRVAF